MWYAIKLINHTHDHLFNVLLRNTRSQDFIIKIYILKSYKWTIGQMRRVFADVPVEKCSIPRRVILKTQKMVLDTALLQTLHYKEWFKVKVEQSREWSNALSYTLV